MSKICCDDIPSAKKPQRPSITYHFPLYIVSVTTGLACPTELKRYVAKNSVYHRVYSVFLVVVIVGLSLYSAYGRYVAAYKYLLQTVRINDIMQQALLLISTVYAILNVTFCGSQKLNEYFNKLKCIDNHLCTTIDLKRRKILYYIRFFLVHVTMLVLCVCDYLAWSYAMGYGIWKYYSFRLFTYYLNIIVVMQITSFACTLKTRFQILNECLINTFKSISNQPKDAINELRSKIIRPVLPPCMNLRGVITIHDLLCDIVDLLNDFYGFNIVLLVANIIVNIVMALNVVLIFGTGIQALSEKDSAEVIVALNVGWAALFLVSYIFFVQEK